MANWKDHAENALIGAQRLAAGIKRRNRSAAVLNRLRTVIRCQERAAQKEYLALGRYYYNALRDKENPVAEEHCARLDGINAVLDSTLLALEKAAREEDASCIGIIGSADGTTAIVTGGKKGAIFHFGGGPLEIAVEGGAPYRPEEDASEAEEIDLSDVESFDHDPMPEDFMPRAGGTGDKNGEPNEKGAELNENDSLPFEG